MPAEDFLPLLDALLAQLSGRGLPEYAAFDAAVTALRAGYGRGPLVPPGGAALAPTVQAELCRQGGAGRAACSCAGAYNVCCLHPV